MSRLDVEQAIDRWEQALVTKRSQLSAQLNRIEEELGTVEQMFIKLVRVRGAVEILVGGSELPASPAASLTEHVRKLVRESAVPLLATQIRDSCEAAGIKASSRKNLLIQVHTILKRMESDVRKVKIDKNRVAYLSRVS
jgi:hypothetical protein